MTVQQFVGIDMCLSNAFAISLTVAHDTDGEMYVLWHQKTEGRAFLTTKVGIPVLQEAGEPDSDKHRLAPTCDLGSGDYMIPDTMPLPPGVSLKAVKRA